MNSVIAKNKTIVSGVIGAVAMRYATSDLGASFIIRGTAVPSWAVGLVLGAGGSFITDVLSQSVLPHIPKNAKLQRLESIVLHILSAGAAFSVVPRLLNSNVDYSDMQRLAVAGAVTELASQFIHEMTCKTSGACDDNLLF